MVHVHHGQGNGSTRLKRICPSLKNGLGQQRNHPVRPSLGCGFEYHPVALTPPPNDEVWPGVAGLTGQGLPTLGFEQPSHALQCLRGSLG
ncbi:hypothetical protein D3C71_1216530 [compost metagenome]